ncbi:MULTISPECIES: D-alanyl-D-alanine carboxypeptidase family protein [Rhizobium]|uniref:D-alanyl-D-alanine carboxypeptidase (Penicillin-binding protein 5/6) n=1 Tax=Rhizobium lentis TaxID=1138194 RepID=A0A7W9CX63_9HYPH|nr:MULTISPECIES: D-alanyl-D-alanine carboxypeptidase family protein [Rhizobium]MBB4576190.1 D-alanyl-D-alanine carboxypeptidase (penicillin-binding protein 5/6) [Rhizobium lentis]MBB5552499.1 D-alanyl-D-alanine carboxypeptidase (penicillin-binding protein 5/6) [Rhizobium lentis]MBB5562891.1 D-alanyl-D-alanine carboxypeptidase (penicillin-binding protein 5/6) [Rhizobium lentis]MBB5569316.1 D-alanyl-D-alanine carboxypeptidase (penicillin-binding protein 5/6) [Rhizobium lentis]MEB3045804.1 D-alan
MRKLLAAVLTVTLAVSAPLAALAGNASLILDARTGKVLAAENADTLNHPASLTKMMTLYLTFEALKRGRIAWDTPIKMSKYAAARPPTKLGVKAGGTITVREAVYGMIVKSANDAAAAMAETLGGSESGFARMMTAKARQLGMSRTVFVNASGLPNSSQVTTARDMSTLGVALMKHYPNEYRLFSMASFNFRGKTVRGHNNLMYRYQGMDGIKTGYTNASGFNLVSAVKDGNRRVVGVVLGGRTARSRDAKMAALLDRYLGRASGGARLMASVGAKEAVEVASAADASDVPVPLNAPRSAGDAAPNGLGANSLAYADDAVVPLERPAAMDEILAAGKTVKPSAEKADGTWQIQISAAPSADAARALLAQAQSEGGAPLVSASPYTEAVGTGANKIYRARFVGFASKDAAVSACDALKQRSYDCMLLPDHG